MNLLINMHKMNTTLIVCLVQALALHALTRNTKPLPNHRCRYLGFGYLLLIIRTTLVLLAYTTEIMTPLHVNTAGAYARNTKHKVLLGRIYMFIFILAAPKAANKAYVIWKTRDTLHSVEII